MCEHACAPSSHRGYPLLALPVVGLVWAYRLTLGLFLGGRCRFYPSCSQYCLDALREHGAVRGSWLAVGRLARCHPWGGSGVDPVPPVASVKR